MLSQKKLAFLEQHTCMTKFKKKESVFSVIFFEILTGMQCDSYSGVDRKSDGNQNSSDSFCFAPTTGQVASIFPTSKENWGRQTISVWLSWVKSGLSSCFTGASSPLGVSVGTAE